MTICNTHFLIQYFIKFFAISSSHAGQNLYGHHIYVVSWVPDGCQLCNDVTLATPSLAIPLPLPHPWPPQL